MFNTFIIDSQFITNTIGRLAIVGGGDHDLLADIMFMSSSLHKFFDKLHTSKCNMKMFENIFCYVIAFLGFDDPQITDPIPLSEEEKEQLDNAHDISDLFLDLSYLCYHELTTERSIRIGRSCSKKVLLSTLGNLGDKKLTEKLSEELGEKIMKEFSDILQPWMHTTMDRR